MRAFISHSSKDKGFIDGVVSLLKPGTFELDSETFDAGLVNSPISFCQLNHVQLR